MSTALDAGEKRLGRAIQIARARAGLEQRLVAKKVGISGPMLSLIERGKRRLTPENEAKLLRALDIPKDVFDLLAGRRATTDARCAAFFWWLIG